MAKHRQHLRLLSTTAAVVAIMAVAPPLAAAADGPTMLSVDQSRPLNTAVQLPAGLRDCSAVPAGAVNGSDGWVFTQPVPNPVAFAYTIGFIDVTPTGPQPVLLLVTGSGVLSVPVDSPPPGGAQAARTAAAAAVRAAATVTSPLSDQPSPTPTPPAFGPPPPGVTGGLIDGGPNGAWLQTPEGWILAAAFLEVAVTTDLTTFDVAAVCPAPDSLPSPSPSATPAHTPSPEPTPTTAHPTPTRTDAVTLPKTGTDTAGLAALGACLIAAGLVLLRIHRASGRQSP